MEKYQFPPEQMDVLESMQVPFAIYQFLDRRVVTLVLSKGFCELFGYGENKEQAYFDMDNNMYKDTHPDDAARIASDAYRFATKGGRYDVIYRTREPGKESYHMVHAIGTHVNTDEGIRLAQVYYIDEGSYVDDAVTDVMDLNRTLSGALHQDSIGRENFYDFQTGLPGINYFFELAEAGGEALRAKGETPVMLFFDLDGMKLFNQRFGYEEGDKLLRAFSQALVDHFSNENCCHIVADHFAAYTKEDGLDIKLASLFDAATKINEGMTLPVRCGIYLANEGSTPVSTAVDRAKYACDANKNIIASTCTYYDPAMGEAVEHRHYIIANFPKALENNWIQVYYQPIIRALNGRVCEEEALSRWLDPVKGMLHPKDFIGILEDSKLIYKLDLFVLETVLKKLKAQQAEGLFIVPQSINLSRSDFEMCDIVEEVCCRVDASGLDRKFITIEVTESILEKDFEYMREQIRRFKDLGFEVWMDDFGSGYSSLDVLQSVDFDLIKFDKTFMDRLNEGEKGKILINELMRLAKALDVDTLCEGVETEEQVDFLREIGCAKLQGFYYNQPVPLEDVFRRYRTGLQIGFEDPEEADYYDTVGRVNIYDLSFIAKGDEQNFKAFFDTLPIAILEKRKDGDVRFVRTNQAYHAFSKRFFNDDLAGQFTEFKPMRIDRNTEFAEALSKIQKVGDRVFINGVMPDGRVVNSYMKGIAYNEKKNKTAIAVAVLSISEK